MKTPWYPLTFDPVYKDYLWGGARIAEWYGRRATPSPCAESWECSSRPEGMSVVNAGHWRGRTLAELIQSEDRHGLLGAAGAHADFPLLLKIIDAKKCLSVQVHPDTATAVTTSGEPKTEAWYILAAEPGASLYCGLTAGVTPEILKRAAAGHDPEAMQRLLRRRPVTAGDVVFVPGGRVHAIGAGILLLEVQQNSDTTFRLYDWGRLGPDGKPRALHLDQALAVIDWKDAGDRYARVTPLKDVGPRPDVFQTRVACRWFVLEQRRMTQACEIQNDGTSFHAWFTVNGGLKFESSDGPTTVPAGTTVLMPAAIGRYRLQPSAAGRETLAIRITIPQ